MLFRSSVASAVPGLLTIRVQDNGKGMEETLMQQLNAGDLTQPRQGQAIGVRNVIARVQMYYGARGSVRFFRSPQGGLTVEIQIPLEQEEKE